MRDLLDEYPFAFTAASVSILGGADEGAFQWLTLNYLLGNLGGGIQARRRRRRAHCAAARARRGGAATCSRARAC